MHARAVAAVAALACASGALASFEAYMAVPGSSLVRRDTLGYQPKLQACNGGGNTCASACGTGCEPCAVSSAGEDKAYCFNKLKKETCCGDGSGHSCDAGFYCTNDSATKNWCCPEGMSLSDCASKYHVSGELKLATSASSASSAVVSSTSAPPETTSSSAATVPYATPSAESIATSSEAPAYETPSAPTNLKVVNTTVAETTTVCPSNAGAGSSFAPGYTSAWAPVNGTASAVFPTQPGQSLPPYATSQAPAASGVVVSGAPITEASSFLALVVGLLALL